MGDPLLAISALYRSSPWPSRLWPSKTSKSNYLCELTFSNRYQHRTKIRSKTLEISDIQTARHSLWWIENQGFRGGATLLNSLIHLVVPFLSAFRFIRVRCVSKLQNPLKRTQVHSGALCIKVAEFVDVCDFGNWCRP